MGMPTSWAQLYEQDFTGIDEGATDLGDGSIIASNDGTNSVQGGALRITQSGTNSTAASFVLPPFDASAGWSASFDFVVEHTGGNTPADGFSFNYGDIPEGENFGSPAEEGYDVGVPHVSFQLDTWLWDDEAQDAGVGIEVAGEEIAFNKAFGDDANFKPGELTSATAVVSWDPANGASFQTLGLVTEADFVNVPTLDFTGEANYGFSFLARTGGHNETVIIDNLKVGPLGSFTLQARDPKISGNRKAGLSAQAGGKDVFPVQITNEGATQDLILTGADITGADAGNFRLVTDSFPITIAPGGTATVEVEFTAPAVLSISVATLNVQSNDDVQSVGLAGAVIVTGGSYAQNFDGFANGTTDLGDDSIMESIPEETTRIENGTLFLTESGLGGTSAGFKVPRLGGGGNEAFIMTFDLALEGEGTPADGFSINYGEIGDTGTAGEEGYGSGIAVEFDTYNNGGEQPAGFDTVESGIGIDISVDGKEVPGGVMRVAGDADPVDNDFFQFDGQFRPVEISWFKSGENSGILTLAIDGKTIYDNIETPGFDPQPSYRFAFGARTGGASESVIFDNLNIITGTEDPNLFTRNSVNLGLVQPDAGIQSITIPVRNTGSDTELSISSVVLTPADSAVFTLKSSPTSVAPGGQGAIELDVDPSMVAGLASAEITINSNDPSEPTSVITLSISAPLSPVLLGWYKMDETEGTTMLDSSGNGRDGTYVGGVVFGETALADGTAVQFTSAGADSGYGTIPAAPALYNTSVSMWVQKNSTSTTGVASLFSKTLDSDAAYSLAIFEGFDNLLTWIVSEDAEEFVIGLEQTPLTEKTHVALVHQDDNGSTEGALSTKLYFDGVEVASVDSPIGFTDSEDSFLIGARLGDNGFPGVIDDVQLYNRALTAEEVSGLFANPGTVIGIGEVIPEPEPEPTVPIGEVAYNSTFDVADDTTDLGDGSIIDSTDGVNSIQNGVLQMTLAETGGTGASFVLPPFNVSAGWTATFDFAIEHVGADTPADGFSFNYGAIPDNQNFGDPAEEGYGSAAQHVSFQVDTWLWNDPAGQDAGIGIELTGRELVLNKAADDEANVMPNERVEASAVISWNPVNGASFTTTGLRTNADFTNIATDGFEAEPEYGFSFLARTGGHNETVEIDNLVITSGASAGGPVGPVDGTEVPVITTVSKDAGGVNFSFLGLDGKTYSVEYSEVLQGWEIIASELSGDVNYTDDDAGRTAKAHGYYRAIEQ
ncbi:MAG: hypothetical protein ACI8T1_003866 [Verrucomicrobiales bacterium]|jgi:hypothetical protein